jgi:uncharacterized OB-fold protein
MSLTERLQFAHEARAWQGAIPLQSRYSMGIAGERFFREIKDNARLLATYCPQCDYTYLPPRAYCERCFAELTDWVEVPPLGIVYSYTVLYQDLEEQPLKEPLVVAFVRLPGCDGGLIHLLEGVPPDEVCIGMPVRVVFKRKREGSILDIAGFRPV